jgi:hypothetical protein
MIGVSVGFSLFLVWQQFNTARQIAQNEAASVERLYSLAQRFPQPERDRVQQQEVSYARGVVEEEWPSMRRGVASQQVGRLLEELRRVVQEFEPHTAAAQGALYAEALAELDELEESRQSRVGSPACWPLGRGYPTSCGSRSSGRSTHRIFYLPLRDGKRSVARRGGGGADGARLPHPPRDRRPGLPL